MSFSTLKPVSCGINPAAGANGLPSKPSKLTMMNTQVPPPPQVKMKEQAQLQESLSGTSRRELMHLTAASVGLLSLLLPTSAEARPRNASMRQKIMEKFEKLREKAGLSKPKDEVQELKPKDGIESKSKITEKFEELKEKTGFSKPKDEGQEVKPKDGVEKAKDEIMEKFEELKEKTGFSKPKDEGHEMKPKDGVEKAKDEKKHAPTPEKSTVHSTKEPAVPALPNIINGRTVEPTLP